MYKQLGQGSLSTFLGWSRKLAYRVTGRLSQSLSDIHRISHGYSIIAAYRRCFGFARNPRILERQQTLWEHYEKNADVKSFSLSYILYVGNILFWCRQQVSEFVRVDSAQDPPAADARVDARLPGSLPASSRVAAASTLQHARLPRHALLEAVRADRRQGLGHDGGAVWPAAATQPRNVIFSRHAYVWRHRHRAFRHSTSAAWWCRPEFYWQLGRPVERCWASTLNLGLCLRSSTKNSFSQLVAQVQPWLRDQCSRLSSGRRGFASRWHLCKT